MTLVVGSTALQRWYHDWPREPKDLDTFCRPEMASHHAENFWHWMLADTTLDRNGYATPDEMLTIKTSHLYWDLPNNSWPKHAGDILWLKRRGAVFNNALHDYLRKMWEDTHGTKRVDLKMSAGEFFDDAVPRIYDHDSIHSSVAYGDHALYEDFLKPGEEIAIDMAAVKSAPFDIQVLLYREEIAATALERIMIPSNYRASPRRAWAFALRRTATSLTKGWSAKFIATNLEHFWEPDGYVERHRANGDRLIRLEDA